MSLLERFEQKADAHPDKAAIIERTGMAISYSALNARAAALARTLALRGVGKGDRILVGVWPSIDLYASLAAVWWIGAVAVFPEPATGLAGFRHAARATTPKALLGGPLVRTVARLFPETRAIPLYLSPSVLSAGRAMSPISLRDEDPALISFTSGTTGTPKGIVRSHGLMLAQHVALSPLIAPDDPGEIDLVAFPAFVLSCLGYGTTAVMPRWNLRRHDRVTSQEVVRQIDECGITRALVPPVVTTAMASVSLPALLRRVLTGGGPLYPDVARRFLANSPSVGLTVVYGSTEAEPISHIAMETLRPQLWAKAEAGAGLPVGAPVAEARIKIINDEIVVTGPHVNRGYLDPTRDMDTKIPDGDLIWHRTGDTGSLDEDGRLWLLGRAGSVAAGLHPFAVETAARLWPGVRAAALGTADGKAVLFVQGDDEHLEAWRRRSNKLGDVQVVVVRSIPMDSRHRSKPDLRQLLADLAHSRDHENR